MCDSDLMKFMENIGGKVKQAQPTGEVVLRIAGQINQLLSGRQIRRDYSIKQQLYFVSVVVEFSTMCARFYLSQAFANSTKQIQLYTFLEFWFDGNKTKKGRKESLQSTSCQLVDEVSKHFYFINNSHRNFNIAIYELSFDTKEDNFGYRRVTVNGSPRNIIIDQRLALLRSPRFLITQSSGQLMTTCSSISDPLCHMPAVIKFTKDGLSASVVPGKGKFKASGKKVSAQSMLISRLGHLVAAFMTEKDRHMFVCSYNNKLELLNCLKIEKDGLLTDCFIEGQVQPTTRFQMLGHVHKYVVFLIGGVMTIALKLPKDWYMRKQLPDQYSQLSSSGPPEGSTRWLRGHLLGNDLYCMFGSDDGHNILTRRQLGEDLKGYRCCSYCEMKETHKRRNKAGKRIAHFKVCRVCKEQNKCRPYCSYECVKKDWKEHKMTH